MRDKNGLTIDISPNNQILDTRLYKLEYKDSNRYSLVTNALAKNMFSQFNGEVNWHVLSQEIVDHRYNGTEVKNQDAFITTRTETNCHREMVKWVEVLLQCKDGSTT